MKGGDEKKLYNIVFIKIMKEEVCKRKFIYIKMLLPVLIVLCAMIQPMTTKADGIPVSLGYVPFMLQGMSIIINGEAGFRSSVFNF